MRSGSERNVDRRWRGRRLTYIVVLRSGVCLRMYKGAVRQVNSKARELAQVPRMAGQIKRRSRLWQARWLWLRTRPVTRDLVQ